MREKELLTYNLQKFAEDEQKPEETKKSEESKQAEKPKEEVKEKKEEKSELSSGDIQKLMNDYAKLKRAFDKTSSELAETKKSLKEKMTEQEIASQEKAEAEAKREEEFEFYKRKDKIHETEKAYLKLGYTADEAERIAVAEADNDFETRTKIMKEVEDRKVKELEAKFYADRPDVNAGSGSDVVTKEKFDQMSLVEKSKLRASDPEAYERFIGRKA